MADRKSILIIVTSHSVMANGKPTGLWLEEFAVPYRLFKERGYRITVASPKGGRIPLDPSSLPESGEPEADEAYQALLDTEVLSRVDTGNFDAVFFPGGHGTMYDLPTPEVAASLGEFFNAGKPVAAVCHGPAALTEARDAEGKPLVSGRRVAAFTNEEEQAVGLQDVVPFLLESRLRELGGEFVAAPAWKDHVVMDGNLITGQNPQSSTSTAKAVIEALER